LGEIGTPRPSADAKDAPADDDATDMEDEWWWFLLLVGHPPMAFSVDSELLARLKSTADVNICWEEDNEEEYVAFLMINAIRLDCD